jgi:hypothetical protein
LNVPPASQLVIASPCEAIRLNSGSYFRADAVSVSVSIPSLSGKLPPRHQIV